jgi:hypothetical protein
MRSHFEAPPKSRAKFDFQAYNLDRIIENAAMAKLRTLKVFIISKLNLEIVYEYDVIVPRPHMTKEVQGIIQEEQHSKSSSRADLRKDIDLLSSPT